MIRLNTETGAGTSIGEDNSLPEGVQGLIALRNAVGNETLLIAAVDDPHSTAISVIAIDAATMEAFSKSAVH